MPFINQPFLLGRSSWVERCWKILRQLQAEIEESYLVDGLTEEATTLCRDATDGLLTTGSSYSYSYIFIGRIGMSHIKLAIIG